jgi:ribosomal protein S18 acetylase RimI-like enzyme
MIRNLTTKDYEEFCRVRLESLKTYEVAFSSMPEFFINASKEMKLKLLEESESDSSNFILGYFQDEKLLGLIGFRRETRESVNHKGSMWGFVVDFESQNKGIGKELIDAYVNQIKKDKNIKYIRLMVATVCERAIKLFTAAGFIQYGLETESISDGKNFFDQIYMKKAL